MSNIPIAIYNKLMFITISTKFSLRDMLLRLLANYDFSG